MRVRSRQLVFDFAGTPRFERDDFLVSSSNQAAVSMLDSWPHWPGPAMLLVGPPGSGKSHLAALWSRDVGATRCGETIPPSVWTGGGRAVLLEDCDRKPYADVEFFHALNMARETNGSVLVTARTAPSNWGIATADLLSRLRQASVATLAPPDPELVRAVLIKLFDDRQIKVEADVVGYAALHCEQTLEAINRFVQTIDETALADGRRITKPLAAATLAAMSN